MSVLLLLLLLVAVISVLSFIYFLLNDNTPTGEGITLNGNKLATKRYL
jgi:hypothetical protein